MKAVIAGQGAFGQRHIEACREIPGAQSCDSICLCHYSPSFALSTSKSSAYK